MIKVCLWEIAACGRLVFGNNPIVKISNWKNVALIYVLIYELQWIKNEKVSKIMDCIVDGSAYVSVDCMQRCK